jgi:two-component system nitrate/nitrite response regulator NarL
VASADELLQSKLQLQRPLFLVVHTGDDFEGAVEQIELFKEQHPEGRIAVVTDRYRRDQLVLAFRAGASGYLVDIMTCDVFVRSIELIMMGQTVFPPAFAPFALSSPRDRIEDAAPRDEGEEVTLVPPEETTTPRLSPRERSILHCLVEGDSNKCIARKFDIAETTVKVHVKAILRKIRVQNRTQAAIWGMNNGSPARSPHLGPPLPTIDVSRRLASPLREIEDNHVTPGGGRNGCLHPANGSVAGASYRPTHPLAKD